MAFTDLLWLLVWGGMFTGIYNLRLSGGLSDPLALFQAVRALFPARGRLPVSDVDAGQEARVLVLPDARGVPIRLLLRSAPSPPSSCRPNRMTALYWAAEYAAPLLVVWVATEMPDPLGRLRKILYLNNIIVAAHLLRAHPRRASCRRIRRAIFPVLYGSPLVWAK